MRISLKVIAILWVGLFLIIGGLLYSAYSQLKPDTFLSLITEQVQKNYPGSKLHVEKISHGFSLDFNLTLKNIYLRRGGKLIGSIGEVELKVPWWLLLTNRGNAQVNISKLDIFVDQEELPSSSRGDSAISPQTINVSLPTYLTEARFTVRAKEVSVRDIHNARRFFTVSKLLVREFQYGKNSAFEINIPIEIKHNDVSYTSDLWLFGDVTPEFEAWQFNYRGEFRTRENNDKFQLEDIVIDGKSIFKPNVLGIQSEVDLLIDKKSIGKGSMKASQEELNLNLNFTHLPMNYFSFVYEEIKNPYLKSLEGDAAGIVKFKKNFNTNTANVDGKLAFNGDLQLPDSSLIPGKWQVSFENARWEVSFISPKGEASFFRRSFMDMKNNKVIQFNEELGFSGLSLNQTISAVKPISDFMQELSRPYFVSTVSCKKCLQGDKIFDGLFKYGFSPDLKFYQADLSDENSSMKINFSQRRGKLALDLNFVNFNWYSEYHFLKPYFEAQSAILDGKVEGRWVSTWESGEWLSQIKAKELAKMKGKIPDFINNTARIFNLNSQEIKTQSLNFSVRNNVLTVNSLMLEDVESAKISGLLSSKQKSSLSLTYPKNKKFKPVKKEIIEPYWMNKEEL